MARLAYTTAGESHGPGLTVILRGLPSGLALSPADVDPVLARRQMGYGRGGRMAIERDEVQFQAGVLAGKTTGAPVALFIPNRDDTLDRLPPVTTPRPGHADLAGCLKYDIRDARPVLERASARETAARAAAGAVAEALLGVLGVQVFSHVLAIGSAEAAREAIGDVTPNLLARRDGSSVFCLDEKATAAMEAAIDEAKDRGDSLGGVVEAMAVGVVPGLGSPDDRLDARIAHRVMAVPSVKGVEIGPAFANASKPGSQVHDAIEFAKGGPSSLPFRRPTNRAGGLEGGMTNGEPVVIPAALKPIPTLSTPLETIDLEALAPAAASRERADTCAIPAASVVVETQLAFEIAAAYREALGGHTVGDMVSALAAYRERICRMFVKEE